MSDSVEYWQGRLAREQTNLDYQKARYERALSGRVDLPLRVAPAAKPAAAAQPSPKNKTLDQKMRERGWDEESAFLGGMLASLILIPTLLFGGIMLFAEPGPETTPGISEVQP